MRVFSQTEASPDTQSQERISSLGASRQTRILQRPENAAARYSPDKSRRMPKYAVGGDSGTIIQNTGAAGAKAVQARTYVSSKRQSHRASRHDIGSSIQPPANAAGSLSPPRYMDVQATIKAMSAKRGHEDKEAGAAANSVLLSNGQV